MKHHAAPDFWVRYHRLPANVQRAADRVFDLLKADPQHPSLHLKKLDEIWSVRVSLHHRALAVKVSDGFLWFWIGTHAEYDDIGSANSNQGAWRHLIEGTRVSVPGSHRPVPALLIA